MAVRPPSTKWRDDRPALYKEGMRLLAALALLAMLAAGCGDTLYVARLGWSEARILLRSRPIPELVARADLDGALRERLALTLAVREFARDRLGLRVGESYTSFADVGPEATVWVLSAARRDRLEAHTWWFPIVGRVPYRGFPQRATAEAAGRALTARGLDVDVRPALAFSTLGWFADPLLSSTAAVPPVVLAETLIHELFHATLYVPGQAAFNESAATFAGHRGAMAYFCGGPGNDGARCTAASARWEVTRTRGRVLGRLATSLRRLYARSPSPVVRERTRAWLARAAARALARRGLGDATEVVPPNNARLLGALLYATDLEVFDGLAATAGDVAPALAALVQAADGAGDPFAAARSLANCKTVPAG